jgi:hypothetical protein
MSWQNIVENPADTHNDVVDAHQIMSWWLSSCSVCGSRGKPNITRYCYHGKISTTSILVGLNRFYLEMSYSLDSEEVSKLDPMG